MFISKENFDAWMERIMDRFDKQDKALAEINKYKNMLNKEDLLDNYDLCKLLNVSKRTLQRYRSKGELPYLCIHKKTFYRLADVHQFIRNNADKNEQEE